MYDDGRIWWIRSSEELIQISIANANFWVSVLTSRELRELKILSLNALWKTYYRTSTDVENFIYASSS